MYATPLLYTKFVLWLLHAVLAADPSWGPVDVKDLSKQSASVGGDSSPSTYDVYYKKSSITIVNYCKEQINNEDINVPIKVAWKGSGGTPELKLGHASDGKALVVTMPGGEFKAWLFGAYPMQWEAAKDIPCPDCDKWSDLAKTTNCALPKVDGVFRIDKVFTCPDDNCTGRRVGSMWDTKGNLERKRMIAYCKPGR